MNFEELCQHLQAFEQKEFGVGASLMEIEQAQQQLGLKFPASYIAFLRKFGWGGVEDLEIFGLGTDVPTHLNLVKLTCSERKEMQPKLPLELLPIMNDGAGNLYCIDTVQIHNNECPVVFWEHECSYRQGTKVVSDNFVMWFSEKLDEF